MAPTKSRKITGAFTAEGDVKDENIDNIIDQSIEPETLNFAVDVRDSGHAADWKWSWNPTLLPYARDKITLEAQSEVPIYRKGTYRLDNFAAFNTNGNSSQTHKIKLKWIEEPGDANLVDWVTYDSGNYTFDGVADSAQRAQRLSWVVPETITLPTLQTSTTTYNVGHSAGKYQFTGIEMGLNPEIGPLRRGNTYEFVVDASGHPFYLTTDNGDNFVAGSYVGEYTSGVTNSRTDNGTLTFVVPSDAPDGLFYQCGNHSGMRGTITIQDLSVETNNDGDYVLYFQHDQEGHATPAPVKPVPTITGQMCLTFDAAKGRFVPQDLRHYMEQTTTFAEKIQEEIEKLSINENRMKTFMREKSILDENEIFNAGAGGLDSAKVESIFEQRKGTVIDSDYINSRLGVTSAAEQKVQTDNHTTLQQDGILAVTTGTARWYAPRDVELIRARAHVRIAPAGANLEIRINKNGSSLHTMSITSGQTNALSLLSPPLELNEGDYLTVDITGVGSSTAGSDLNLVIRYK